MTRQARGALSLVLVFPALMLAAAPARADSATVAVPGDPMRILVGTQGGLQANVGGASSNVFFPPSSETGNAGFFLGFPAGFGSFSAGTVAGSPSTSATTASWTEVSQGPVAGSGTKADPLTQITDYRLDDGSGAVIGVTQAISYVNGERRFAVAYAVRNLSPGPVQFRASTGADLYLDGSDVGVGFLSGGPPRLVGGVNQVTGVAGGIEENATSPFPPWSHFQESVYTSIFSAIGDPTGPGFADTVDPTAVDNGVGVQWDDHYASGTELASGATAAYSLVWNFGSPPPTVGETANVEPVTGSVLVALAPAPGSARAAQVKGATFVPLSQARQIPVGSFLDTSQGTVKLTSATGVGGQTQTGDFTGGVFQVLQARRANAATELRLKGGRFRGCAPRGSAGGARVARRRLSRRTVRRLKSTADGRFRTRGRHSSATVRGTTWITTDRCDGTLTRVTRGRVAVRDFRRRRSVVVRAGKSYLARARR